MKENIYLAAIYILSCVLHSEKPSVEMLAPFSDRELYQTAKKHSVTSLIGYGMRQISSVRQESSVDWETEVLKLQRKAILMDAEKREILQFMEQSGIWYVPLKGLVIKDLYPCLGLREMADNDILIDPNYREDVKQYMLARGYEYKKTNKYKDDIYLKLPRYNFEMHVSLYEKADPSYEYFKDIRKLLIKDEGNQYGYHFSNEVFYLYLISHIYKHIYYKGTGIKSLADVYICAQKMHLDREYVDEELKKLKLYQFEHSMRHLAVSLFKSPEWPDLDCLAFEEKELFNLIVHSGTYGNDHNRAINRLSHYVKGKVTYRSLLGYYFNRVFPDSEWIRLHMPDIYGHRFRTFLFYITRLCGAVKKLPWIIKEIKLVFNQRGKMIKWKW